MKFFPSIPWYLDSRRKVHDRSAVLPGQWVRAGRLKGRIVDPKSLRVLWMFKGESFRSWVLRFRVAIRKGRRCHLHHPTHPKPVQMAFFFRGCRCQCKRC